MKPFSFYLVTDTHFYESSLGVEGKAFDDYMSREQYYMKESGDINRATFAEIAKDKDTQIVIMPGDLTKNGEKESHNSFVKLLEELKSSGKKIFVITAGHDYGEKSFAFRNDERIEVEGTSFDELYDFYRDYGYSEALAFDRRTHSYIAEITDGVRMLAINCDSCGNPKGAVDGELLDWMQIQLDKAKADGSFVFAICHYPIIPSVPVFDLVGDAKIKEWRKVASFLADNGVEVILTGHMHIQSINEFTSEKGNRLIDICTSCLVGSPAKYRKISISEDKTMKIESLDVECGYDLGGLTKREYFDNQFANAILTRVRKPLSGGKGIVGCLKKKALNIIDTKNVAFLAHLLHFRVDKELGKKSITDFISSIGLALFLGDAPFVEGTAEHKLISSFLKRFSFIIGTVEKKLSKNGEEINLTDMLLNTIGNNKGYSDNNAQFKLK